MKKKVVSILLAVSMTSSVLVACGATNGTNAESSSASSTKTYSKPDTSDLDLAAEGDTDYDDVDWDSHPLLSRIPNPNTDKIKIESDAHYGVDVSIEDVSQAGFKKYSELCKDSGFTVDYYYSDGYFNAKSEDGYSLSMDYYADDKKLNIYLNPPRDNTDSNSNTGESTSSSDANSTSTSNTSVSSESSESEVDTQSVTAIPEPTEAAEKVTFDIKDKTVPETGVRQEIKAFVESYEAFAQTYSDFMKTYCDANTEYTDDLYKKYDDLMKQAEDYSNKYSALTEIDLSAEEYTYILDSYNKIIDKLYDY